MSLPLAFTDIRDTAPWRSTYLQSEPWVVKPAYAELVGFCIQQICPDLLHIWNLGVARDLIGTTMKLVLQERVVFTGSNADDRLKEATESLREYARSHGHSLRMKRFTKKKLTWQSKKYPEFRGSGSDAAIVCTWLESVLAPHANLYGDLCTLLWASNRAMRLFYSAGRFLSENERNTVLILGRVFCRVYLNKAVEAVQHHTLLWRVRPKFHMLVHLVEMPNRCLNPSFYSTWMDEDFLKKISRTMRLTSVKTAQVRILERWLLSIPFNLQEVRSQNQPTAWKISPAWSSPCIACRTGAGGDVAGWVWFWCPTVGNYKTVKPQYLWYSFQMVLLPIIRNIGYLHTWCLLQEPWWTVRRVLVSGFTGGKVFPGCLVFPLTNIYIYVYRYIRSK